MPKRYNRCYMTSWITKPSYVSFSIRELPTKRLITAQNNLKVIANQGLDLQTNQRRKKEETKHRFTESII